MNNEFTIVVPDNKVLSCVCGTNDSNLKLIEEHLGIPVFTKGNELSIENDNITVYVSHVDRSSGDPKLMGVDDEEEWNRVKDVLRELSKAE